MLERPKTLWSFAMPAIGGAVSVIHDSLIP